MPDNIEKLFNTERLRESISEIKTEYGSQASKLYVKQIKQIEKLLKAFSALLKKKDYLVPFIASYQTRKIWVEVFNSEIDPKILSLYLAGACSLKRLQDPSHGGRTISENEEEILNNCQKEIASEIKNNLKDNLKYILKDISKFRLHLKYARFAHRVFNRLTILTEDADIDLSRQAGTLFQLPCADEIEQDEAKIVHHTILKADVRGSTVVTEMLEKKNLNPASYFSTNFFSPINEIIPVYGGEKVFIEGDAIILSFLEHENTPQQWFLVARACGLARSMLRVIHANNLVAKQSGLPLLELGIGVCYAEESPRFLFDGDQPIMISSAIGLADRLSSCSWKSREKINSTIFNVDVLSYAESERDKGEKGQELIRYNVNGILLENAAFAKLQNEVKLRKITASFGGSQESLYYGVYKDAHGGRHDIVIREGRIGLWKDDSIIRLDDDSDLFYEVVTNGKVIAVLREKLKSQVVS